MLLLSSALDCVGSPYQHLSFRSFGLRFPDFSKRCVRINVITPQLHTKLAQAAQHPQSQRHNPPFKNMIGGQNCFHTQALPVDKKRNQESLWRKNLSGGNPRTITPTVSLTCRLDQTASLRLGYQQTKNGFSGLSGEAKLLVQLAQVCVGLVTSSVPVWCPFCILACAEQSTLISACTNLCFFQKKCSAKFVGSAGCSREYALGDVHFVCVW